MYKGVVVVCQSWDVSGHPTINVLWVAVVFEVLVVSVYCNRVLGADKQVAPMGATPYKSEEFVVVDVVVPFCFRKQL